MPLCASEFEFRLGMGQWRSLRWRNERENGELTRDIQSVKERGGHGSTLFTETSIFAKNLARG